MEDHGGDLLGYIARYGDIGHPPLDRNGKQRTITIPLNKQRPKLIEGLERVPDTIDQFYLPMYDHGGTAIWDADMTQLQKWKNELNELARTQAGGTVFALFEE